MQGKIERKQKKYTREKRETGEGLSQRRLEKEK
jgi:hypothetical protein